MTDQQRKQFSQSLHRIRARTNARRRRDIGEHGYLDLLEAQGGVCAICKKPEASINPRSGKIIKLHIDHDHKTGLIRGLLCNLCNGALGRFRDDENIIVNAIAYLTRLTTMTY